MDGCPLISVEVCWPLQVKMYGFFDKQGGGVLGLVQDRCVVQSGQWCSFQACFAMADFSVSFSCCLVFFKAGLQASFCLSNVCEITVLQGILYTTPDFLMAGSMSFTLVRCWPKVLMVVNTVLIQMVFPANPPQVLTYTSHLK